LAKVPRMSTYHISSGNFCMESVQPTDTPGATESACRWGPGRIAAIRIAVVRSPWLNQIGQGTQVEQLLALWFGHVHIIDLPKQDGNSEDFGCLLDEQGGSIRFTTLVVPGGNDQRLLSSVSQPQLVSDRIRAFVANGGGFVGICAGMCLASRGYWDMEGWLPASADERQQQHFAHFTGMFPYELENLHGLRRVDLAWNSQLPEDHPMRRALTADGLLCGARYNDGNALLTDGQHPHSQAEGAEYLLRYTGDQPWASNDTIDGASEQPGSLMGKWASIAYVDPANPRSGRLLLDGWHPESVHTPNCHEWLRCAVLYASERTLELHRQEVIKVIEDPVYS